MQASCTGADYYSNGKCHIYTEIFNRFGGFVDQIYESSKGGTAIQKLKISAEIDTACPSDADSCFTTTNGSKYAAYHNRDINGGDLTIFNSVTRDSCADLCEK